MYMLCCWLKIFYYFILIVYHGFDCGLDWKTFGVLYANNTFSGVSISTNSSVVVKILFGVSCGFGTVFSGIMLVVYIYYITYHWYCIHHAGYQSVRYTDGEVSMSGGRRCDKKCNRQFVTLELVISVLELLCKDVVQSAILFWIYISQSILTRPSWQFIAFSGFSVVAHLKLFICFFTKLCGFGAAEESCCDECSCPKVFFCVIGLLASTLFLVLTIVSLVNAVSI